MESGQRELVRRWAVRDRLLPDTLWGCSAAVETGGDDEGDAVESGARPVLVLRGMRVWVCMGVRV
jgi:hypothetical protein